MEVQDVVEIVRVERQNKGLSQYALAKKSGVSREFIANLERGIYVPKLNTLIKLLKALDLEVVVKCKF